MERAEVRHLYVHIPFCRSRCLYCDFISEPIGPHARAGRLEAYVDAVLEELDRRAHLLAPRLQTIYMGGGTPTALPPRLLRKLLERLSSLLQKDGEFTVEARPGSFDEELSLVLRTGGVTRLSLGVQSFHTTLLRVLGRSGNEEEIDLALQAARNTGWRDWNLDLLFGIPGQDWDMAQEDLERAVDGGPTHISLYDLTYTEAFSRHVRGKRGLNARVRAEDFAEEYYGRAIELLQNAGYPRYEISNFSRPGFECRHNLAYWRGEDYLGLGASAVSTVGFRRWTNPIWIADYLAGAEGEVECLTPAVRLLERAMLGFRTSEGVEETEIGEVLDGPALERALTQGWLERRCDKLVMSARGRDVVNAVLTAILRFPSEIPTHMVSHGFDGEATCDP